MFKYFDDVTAALRLSGVSPIRLGHWDQADGGVDVYVVDGKRIRDTMDIQFQHAGHHWDYPYIPRDEVWLDREAPGAGEQQFWAMRKLYERQQALNGVPSKLAKQRAKEMEYDLRRTQFNWYRNFTVGELPDYLGYKVKIVRGRDVRNEFDVDFAMGANGYAVDYVPEQELWVDDALLKTEWTPAVAHQAVHANALAAGATDEVARAKAYVAERRCRDMNSQIPGWDLPPGVFSSSRGPG